MSAFANWFDRGTPYRDIYFPGYPMPTEADYASDASYRAYLERNNRGFYEAGYLVEDGKLKINPDYAKGNAIFLPGARIPDQTEVLFSEVSDAVAAIGSDAGDAAKKIVPTFSVVALVVVAVIVFKLVK